MNLGTLGNRKIRRASNIASVHPGGEPASTLSARCRSATGPLFRRLGVLTAGEEDDPVRKTFISVFTQAVADLGWTDGGNVRMDVRLSGVDIDRIQALAHELVGLQPDIILAGTRQARFALERETRTIPIVYASVIDSVTSDLVARRLDRPGGNITGFATTVGSLGDKANDPPPHKSCQKDSADQTG